jgi:cell division protein FtsI (penicillin-binding protein 3)
MTGSADRFIRLRVWLVGVGFYALLLLIAGRAVYIQVMRGPELAARAADQYQTSVRTGAQRGAIRDAEGRPLAVSLEVASVGAHPRQITDKARTAQRLSDALGIKATELTRLLHTERPFVWIQRHVPPDQARRIEALRLEGITFQREYSRFYPNKHLAGQVLGFCNIDGKGLEGIEHRYEAVLNAETQARPAMRDALGRRFGTGPMAVAQVPAGHDVVLTLNATIQHIAETALQQAVVDHQAGAGVALVIEPSTGAILAMAQAPAFNPNNYRAYSSQQWRNRCITDAFEPGSTMKVFIAAAALEAGIYTPRSRFYCENGKYRLASHVVHDTKPHAWLTMAEVIKYSSNIGAIKIGEGLGKANFHAALQRFGFGDRTGFDFPGETPGSLLPHERWTTVDAGAIAFGHGLSLSALQLATAMGAIANDGILMQPHIVKEIRDPRGQIIEQTQPRPIRQVVSAATARQVRTMLAGVVEPGGTATKAALKDYGAGGKTGTAHKIKPGGGYDRNRFVASFVGLAPLDKPRVVVLVVIDEPRRGHYGGTVAAPVFREICQKTLNFLNVPPQTDPGTMILARQAEATG